MPFTTENTSAPRPTNPESALQRLRLKVGLKQCEMAETLDISATQWQRYEKGKAPVPKVVLYALAYLYGETNVREAGIELDAKGASCTL